MDNTYTFSYFLGALFNGCPVCNANYMSVVFVGTDSTTYAGNDGAGDNVRLGSYYNSAGNPPEHTTDGVKVNGKSNFCMATDGTAALGNVTIDANKFVANCVKSIIHLNNMGSIADHIKCV